MRKLLAALLVFIVIGSTALASQTIQPASLKLDKMERFEQVRDINEVIAEQDQLCKRAIAQYENEDYTPLAEPVHYSILWLGYTDVYYGDLRFQMTDFDKEYLTAVTLNFEKSVERITDHNLDISIDLRFISDTRALTKDDYGQWLYLAKDTVRTDIDKYLSSKGYDTVLTTVQTDGWENYQRNVNIPGYDVHYVILGLETAGITDDIGYSTFLLGEPIEGTYPLQDPEIPSLYATAIAVHEWMHQLEPLGTLLGIEYPNTHAYVGEKEFPGYSAFEADKNNYDFFEFYELVLQGKLPYNDHGTIKHVGVYPEMWPLVKHNALSLGDYAIVNAKGEYLAPLLAWTNLTLSREMHLWHLKDANDNRVIFESCDYPEYRIDLENAWDAEGNNVNIQVDTGYIEAQSWFVTLNQDDSSCIRTAYGSGRALSIDTIGGEATIRFTYGEPRDSQKWYFFRAKQ
ncbi:MAG: hypothetical protein E7317_02360 [Clostridiales bacterium]|nr:hypothetical protein [Clostridiales bacterium]